MTPMLFACALVVAAGQTQKVPVSWIRLEHKAAAKHAKEDFPRGSYGLKIWRSGEVRLFGYRNGRHGAYRTRLSESNVSMIFVAAITPEDSPQERGDLYPDYSNPSNHPEGMRTLLLNFNEGDSQVTVFRSFTVKYSDQRASRTHFWITVLSPEMKDWAPGER